MSLRSTSINNAGSLLHLGSFLHLHRIVQSIPHNTLLAHQLTERNTLDRRIIEQALRRYTHQPASYQRPDRRQLGPSLIFAHGSTLDPDHIFDWYRSLK